jgi:hypothetical protein
MLPMLGSPRRQVGSNLTLSVTGPDSFSRDHCSGRFSLVSDASVPSPAHVSPNVDRARAEELPPGWVVRADEHGTPFYYSASTQESRWVRPGAPPRPPARLTPVRKSRV